MTSQEGTLLTFAELRPARVVDELVGFLPDWEPVNSAPVTYVQDDAPTRDDDGEFFGGIDAPPPAPSNGPQAAERFFRAPVVRAGVIACAIREPGTALRRGRKITVGPLNWFDTTDGRFFLTTEQLSDGAQRHTVTPADRARIAQWLRDRINAERAGY